MIMHISCRQLDVSPRNWQEFLMARWCLSPWHRPKHVRTEYDEELKQDLPSADTRQLIEDWRRSPDWGISVAYYKGKIVGAIEYAYDDFSKPEEVSVELLAVERGYRRKGIGSKLMRHFEKVCRAKRVERIVLEAIHGTHPFYKSLGYRETLMSPSCKSYHCEKLLKYKKRPKKAR